MSEERSKEPTPETKVPAGPDTTAASSVEGAGSAPKKDLPTWGHGKSKRRRNAEDNAGAAAIEGMPSMEALDRGVVRVGKPIFNHVTLVVGALFVVAAGVAGIQYWRGQGDSSKAVATRALAQGLAPMARGVVVPEEEKEPEAMTNPWARTRKELQDKAASALKGAQGSSGGVALAATLAEASLAMRQGDAKAAQAGYERFLQEADPRHPMRPLAAEALALALEQSGQLDKALAQLESLSDAKSPRLQWHLGRIHHGLGHKDQAKASLEKAANAEKGGIESRLAKSLLAQLEGDKKAPTPKP